MDGNEERQVKLVPDRKGFEQELQRLHTHIDATQKEIQHLKNDCLAMNPEMQEYREAKIKMNEESKLVKDELDSIRLEKSDLRKQTLEIEKDCRFRDMSRLEAHLTMQEKRYEEENLTSRNENVLVQEIDALRKNKIKLQKLHELHEIRKDIDKRYDEKYMMRNNLILSFDAKKRRIVKLWQKRKPIEEKIEQLKSTLKRYFMKRNSLIDSYEKNRTEYNDWAKTNHKHSKSNVPSTFPSAQSRFHDESEELEPFFEQKRDCKRLLNYLETQKCSSFDVHDVNSTSMGSDDDSADDLPPALAKLQVTTKTMTAKQKKQVKRASQPMSHQLEIYRLFGNLEIKPPAMYNDIPNAIEQVKSKLEFFEQQTNEIVWNDEDWVTESVGISRTNSEFDETMSDANSFTSSRVMDSRNSCRSPLSTENTQES